MALKTNGPLSSASSRKILQELCSVPTAPFFEKEVIRYVDSFVKRYRNLRLTRDDFGNLLIELPAAGGSRGSGKKSPRWVFTAHMDHPGFVADRMIGGRTLEADFYGGVGAEYFVGSRVKFFDSAEKINAVITAYQTSADGRPNRATLRVSRWIRSGTVGMWDQGEGRFVGKRFLSRVCDDLAGAAAALAMLADLAKKPPKVTVAVLLTRGEEEGFIGAIAASLHPKLLRQTDRIIAIECSAVQPYAPQGGGAIIRIGDRTSVFNSSLSYFLNQVAADRAAKDEGFKYQRALMPGGTCEATVYDVYGFTAASICVPLGNYHNMDRAKKKIGPEFIDVGDWDSMVALFVETCRRGHEYEPGHAALKKKLEARYEKFKRLL